MAEIWLDTANIGEIEKWSWLIDGVTTNPSLLSKEGSGFRPVIDKITGIVKGSVSVEAVSDDAEGMAREGREFAKWAQNIVVKIPMSAEGLKAVRMLSREGIKTNVTLIFTVSQAVIAAKCGATVVSPFAGRVDDHIRKKAGIDSGKSDYFPRNGISKGGSVCDDDGVVSGVDLVARIVKAFREYGLRTRVVSASIRNARQAAELIDAGSDILTVPPHVLEGMLRHPKTDEGIELFKSDWKKVKP